MDVRKVCVIIIKIYISIFECTTGMLQVPKNLKIFESNKTKRPKQDRQNQLTYKFL